MLLNGSEKNHRQAKDDEWFFFFAGHVDGGENLIWRSLELGAEAIGFWIVMVAFDHIAGGIVCLVWRVLGAFERFHLDVSAVRSASSQDECTHAPGHGLLRAWQISWKVLDGTPPRTGKPMSSFGWCS